MTKPKPKRYGRGVRRVPGQMNKLEARYAQHLQSLQNVGQIHWWAFDAIKFRLAEKTFYTPDFLILKADDTLEVHEVKGFWEDDARVKIKVMADKFPLKVFAISLKQDEWVYEGF